MTKQALEMLMEWAMNQTKFIQREFAHYYKHTKGEDDTCNAKEMTELINQFNLGARI